MTAMSRFRWPRGRYNGMRIVGVRATIVIDITSWGLLWFRPYGTCARLGPARIWLEWEYKRESMS
jgi:hypothetical protein